MAKYLTPDRVATSHALTKLEKNTDGRFKATFSTPDGDRVVLAKSVSMTSPTAATSKVSEARGVAIVLVARQKTLCAL